MKARSSSACASNPARQRLRTIQRIIRRSAKHPLALLGLEHPTEERRSMVMSVLESMIPRKGVIVVSGDDDVIQHPDAQRLSSLYNTLSQALILLRRLTAT